jgi:hypothetical protein
MSLTAQAIRLPNKTGTCGTLGGSTRTVDDWQHRGRIAFLKIGRSCRYRWLDVIEKLNQYRVN